MKHLILVLILLIGTSNNAMGISPAILGGSFAHGNNDQTQPIEIQTSDMLGLTGKWIEFRQLESRSDTEIYIGKVINETNNFVLLHVIKHARYENTKLRDVDFTAYFNKGRANYIQPIEEKKAKEGNGWW